jgi:hypothetical protein
MLNKKFKNVESIFYNLSSMLFFPVADRKITQEKNKSFPKKAGTARDWFICIHGLWSIAELPWYE